MSLKSRILASESQQTLAVPSLLHNNASQHEGEIMFGSSKSTTMILPSISGGTKPILQDADHFKGEASTPKDLTVLHERARTNSTSSVSSDTFQASADGSIPEFKKSNSLAKKIRERNAKDATLKLQPPRDMESPMQLQQQGSDKTPISIRLLGASPSLRTFSAMSNEPSLEATSVASSTNSLQAAHQFEPPTNNSSATSTPGSARPPSKSHRNNNGYVHQLSIRKPRNVPNLTLDKIQSPAVVINSTAATTDPPSLDVPNQSNAAPVFQHFSFPKSVSTSNTPSSSAAAHNHSHHSNVIGSSNNMLKGSLISPLPPFESSAASSNGNRSRSRTVDASPKEFVQVESKVRLEQSSEQDELALENDRILNQRLLEAKALNRKDDRGAVMFKFSLWGNTTVSREAIQIEDDSNAAQPKVSSKLRGPKSVRENIKQRIGEALPIPAAPDSLLLQKGPSRQNEDLVHPKNIAVGLPASTSPTNKMTAKAPVTVIPADEDSYSDEEFDRIDEEESKNNLSTSGLDTSARDETSSLSIVTNTNAVVQSTGKSRASALRTMVVEAQALGSPPSNFVVTTIIDNNDQNRSGSNSNPAAVFRKLSFTSDQGQDNNEVVEENCFNSFFIPHKHKGAPAAATSTVTFDAGIPMVEDEGIDADDEEEVAEEMARYTMQRSISYDGNFENDFEVSSSIHDAMSKSGPAAFASSVAPITEEAVALNNHRRRASSSDVSSTCENGNNKSTLRFSPPPLTSLTSRNEKVPSSKNFGDSKKEQESLQPIANAATNGSRNSKYQNMKHMKALQDAKHQQEDDNSNIDDNVSSSHQQLYTVEAVQRALLNASPNLTELSDSDENVKALIQQHAQHRQHEQVPEEKISVDTSLPTVDELNDTQALPAVGSPLKWIKGAIIGEGTFGKVYKGMNEKTGETIAIKQLYLADGSQEEVEELRREIGVMWELDHEHIVRYLGTTKTDRYLYIILEFVTGGSIASMLKQYGSFTENLIKRFSYHILSGVTYLHGKGIIHRDIKGANILVTDTGIAKLADFGCSKRLAGMCTTSLEESMYALRGSVPWMAPEVIKQAGYGRSSDIWSFGATIIEMATGKPPWSEYSTNLAALFHVATASEPPAIPPHLSPLCQAFLSQCMVLSPEGRTTASNLLNDSPFLQEEFKKAESKRQQTQQMPSYVSENQVLPQQLYSTPVRGKDRVIRPVQESRRQEKETTSDDVR